MQEPLWSVPRDWLGDTAYIIAGGPSVKTQNLSLLSGKRVIVVNSSWKAWPKADLLFFADQRWWSVYGQEVLQGFPGKIATTSYLAKHARLLKLQKQKPPPGLTRDPEKVVVRFTSLHGAINLAVNRGAAKIVLLGVDMQRDGNGATHHHEPHKWPQKPDCWNKQMEDLELTVPLLAEWGIEVINTSLDSRVGWWTKLPLEECA